MRKIIKPFHPSMPEKAEIAVHGADDLYREIRIENTLRDENGHERKLKEGADVDVVVEADPSATVPAEEQPSQTSQAAPEHASEHAPANSAEPARVARAPLK